MIIDFSAIEEQVTPNMRGGEGVTAMRIHANADNKIISGRLEPGSSIGLHTHQGNSEVIYILSGAGKVLCDGVYEAVEAGSCHYCPQGHAHSLINDGPEELRFFAVVPQHG